MQIQTHYHRIFRRVGIVVRPRGNRLETTLFIKCLGRRISTANLKKSSGSTLFTRFLENTAQQETAITATPILVPHRDVVDVQFPCGFPGDDVTGNLLLLDAARAEWLRYRH